MSKRDHEYFRRQGWIAFEPVEGTLPLLAEYTGPHKSLWASDYPPVDGFPGAAAMMIAGTRELNETAKREILGGAATTFYRPVSFSWDAERTPRK